MRSEPSARSLPISTFPARPEVLGDEVHSNQADEAERRPRYYRPDRCPICCGASRRLLYGEATPSAGCRRILKEHGIASVQRLADGSAIASFGAIEEAVGLTISEMDHEPVAGIDVDDDDYEGTDGIDFRLLEDDEEELSAGVRRRPDSRRRDSDASGRCRASGRRV